MALTPPSKKEDEEEGKDLSEEEVEALESAIADHITANE